MLASNEKVLIQLVGVGLFNNYAHAKSKNMGWLSKNRQTQGAKISRNETYIGTSQ